MMRPENSFIDRKGTEITEYSFSADNQIGEITKLEDGSLRLKATKEGSCRLQITNGKDTVTFRWVNNGTKLN